MAALLAGCTTTPGGPSVTSVEITPSDSRVAPGETVQLKAVLSPEGVNQAVTWESDKPACVTVSQSGLVTGVSKGTAVITAWAGSVRGRCNVTVTPEPFPITFARTELDTTMVATEELNYKFRYNCYDPFKVQMQLLDNNGMASQFTNSPGDGYLQIWDRKRTKSVATCRVKIYDDISEQIIKVTVREKK